MPLVKGGQIVHDPWIDLDDDAAPPADGPVIVSLARWRRDRQALIARGGPVGVRLAPADSAADLAEDLDHVGLVAIEFPIFRDGRGFSHARLLRERHGFAGEIQAVGHVLRDQFLFLHRCGFDAVAIEDPGRAAAWRDALSEFTVWYQPATDSRVPAWRLRHRRVAAAE